MAQVKRSAEEESVNFLQGQAVAAANAFRDYLTGSDEAKRREFISICSSKSKGKPLTENKTFMERLLSEINALRDKDPQIKPLADAFAKDQGRLGGFLWKNPAVYTDFLAAVHAIREGVLAGVPREKLAVTYGDELVPQVVSRMPAEQARLCTDAFRAFMLTGDPIKGREFQRIFSENSDDKKVFNKGLIDEFYTQLQKQFTERVIDAKGTTESEILLSKVVHAYISSHPDFYPLDFAEMVAKVYAAAIGGEAKSIEALRASSVDIKYIDPLLALVAKGTARRAVDLMLEVLETGSQTASDEFGTIMSGKIATLIEGKLSMEVMDRNEAFWAEFSRLYANEVIGNQRLSSMFKIFNSNALPIAVRDIFAELSKTAPDKQKLMALYGADLVEMVELNVASMRWMMRSEAEMKTQIARWANLGDQTALSILSMRTEFDIKFNIPRALADIYPRLVALRVSLHSIEGVDIIGMDHEAVRWLSGDAKTVQAEIDKRAADKKPDKIARALKSKYGAKAGEIGSKAFAAIAEAAKKRETLVGEYGKDFVDFCWNNLGSLYWLMKPATDIGNEMVARPDDALMRGVQTQRDDRGGVVTGFSPTTLAHALRDIHSELGKAAPDRARIERCYGADLVDFVAKNRKDLSWVTQRSAYEVKKALTEHDKGTPLAIKAGEWLMGPSPVRFVSALAGARQSVTRSGLVKEDAVDSFGLDFMGLVVSKAAVSHAASSAEMTEQGKREVSVQWQSIERDMVRIEAQLEYQVLEPARPLIMNRLRGWRQENNAIREAMLSTSDPAEIAALVARQQVLRNSMVSPKELRDSIKMVFTMIHMAETGADIGSVPSLVTGTVSDMDTGTMMQLQAWYRSLAKGGRDTEKQAVIQDVVSSVLSRADPRLYKFISSQNDIPIFDAISRVYVTAKGAARGKKADAQKRYDARFVALVQSHARELYMLESPSASMRDLAMAENELFAAITIRVYRALSAPESGEDRAAMVNLFGVAFVRVVESHMEDLDKGDLTHSGAGLSELGRFPSSLRQELFNAYGGAYSRSIGAFARAFRQQDTALFESVDAISRVIRGEPAPNAPTGEKIIYRRKVNELSQAYGSDLVDAVMKNRSSLMFMESPSATYETMRKRLDPEVLESLNVAFEQGPGLGRANFMDNMLNVATRIPFVYAKFRNAMMFYNPVQDVNTQGAAAGTTTANQPMATVEFQDAGLLMTQALELYRMEFGSDDYLFNQYFNLGILNKSIPAMIKRYGIEDPDHVAERGIKTAEDLVRFMNSAEGHELIRSGRSTYAVIEQQYLTARENAKFHPDGSMGTEDFTDAAVMNLRNQLSILDALYLGVALSSMSGSQSALTETSAMAVMNSLLVVEHRDPYLVGPYLLQVLPAILNVAQDEKTLVVALNAFNAIFMQRYDSGSRDIAYSTAVNRRYFLAVFERIEKNLPDIVSTFGHNNLEDELRLVAEPRMDEGYTSPMLYRYKPDFLKMEGLEPLPALYGQNAMPLSLLPRLTMPLNPFLPVPGGLTLNSGAMGLYSGMRDFINPPGSRLFQQSAGPRFRIGALGASSILRRINECFGPMPVNYDDYWLTAIGELGAMYSSGDTLQQTGVAGVGTGRTTTGGARGSARYLETDQTPPQQTASDGEKLSSSTTRRTMDMQAQAMGLPYPIVGVIPLALGKPGPTAKPEAAVSTEIEGRQDDPVVAELTRLKGAATAGALIRVVPELSKVKPDADALEQEFGHDFVDAVAKNLDKLKWVLYPPEEGLGLHRGRMEFHRETSETTATTATPSATAGGPDTVSSAKTPTAQKTKGLIETFTRIGRENKSDMLFYVAGEEAPELTGAVPAGSPAGTVAPITQTQSGKMKSRLVLVTQEGNVYQSDFGYNSQSQLSNYLYVGANRQEMLASTRFMGRDMTPTFPLSDAEKRPILLKAASDNKITQNNDGTTRITEDYLRTPGGAAAVEKALASKGITDDKLYGSAWKGFNGAAIGFTIPRSGGDAVSVLALGQLVRNMSTMDPVHAEQAAAAAFTRLAGTGRHRDIIAVFYRGSERTDLDPADRTHITNSTFTQGSGEVLWRRMQLDPEAYQAEVRFVAGKPLTVGVRARLERHPRVGLTKGYGLTAGITDIDLLQEFRTADMEADQMYSRMRNMLVSAYHWSEDQARDTGYLVAGTYMYSRLEDFTMRSPDGTYHTGSVQELPGSTKENPQYGFTSADGKTKMALSSPPPKMADPNYGSLLMMYWARRHNILVGAQRVPGFGQMYNKIDRAMLDIQRNPENEAATLRSLSESLKGDLSRDIWRFALGYGYQGENLRVFTVGGAQYTADQSSYGNLYGLFLMGRPTKYFADILGHAYTYAPLIVTQDQSGNFQPATRGASTRYLDIWTGVGAADWPAWNMLRYQREAVVSPQPDTVSALLDVYREMGSTTGANWNRLNRIYGEDFVNAVTRARPVLQWMLRSKPEVEKELRKRKDAEDPAVMLALDYRETGTAAALLDVYSELRKPDPDMSRLAKSYAAEFVNLVGTHINDFEWLLLDPGNVKAELSSRAKGSNPEAAIAEARLQSPTLHDRLTGEELRVLLEQNMADVLVSITNSDSKSGLRPEGYDVQFGGHLLGDKETRSGKFYILFTPLATRADSKGSLVIGDETDLLEWQAHHQEIGRGVTRLEIDREKDNYRLTFSGDRQLRSLTAGKIVGGVSIPLTSDAFDTKRMGQNWSMGAVASLLQDYRTDLLGGIMYGRREYGSERYDQWTVTLSGRMQSLNTATMSDQLYGYMFFNRLTKKVVFASDQVFKDSAERAAVFQTLGAEAGELTRTTVGTGITWAKVNITAGDRLNVHAFFEAGTEQKDQTVDATKAGQQVSDVIFRGGVGVDYVSQAERSLYGTKYSLFLTGAKGRWPIMPGELSRPEYMQAYSHDIMNSPSGWWLMLYLNILH